MLLPCRHPRPLLHPLEPFPGPDRRAERPLPGPPSPAQFKVVAFVRVAVKNEMRCSDSLAIMSVWKQRDSRAQDLIDTDNVFLTLSPSVLWVDGRCRFKDIAPPNLITSCHNGFKSLGVSE